MFKITPENTDSGSTGTPIDSELVAAFDVIRSVLAQPGATRQAIASLIGVTPMTLYRWMKGDTHPTSALVVQQIKQVSQELTAKNLAQLPQAAG